MTGLLKEIKPRHCEECWALMWGGENDEAISKSLQDKCTGFFTALKMTNRWDFSTVSFDRGTEAVVEL